MIKIERIPKYGIYKEIQYSSYKINKITFVKFYSHSLPGKSNVRPAIVVRINNYRGDWIGRAYQDYLKSREELEKKEKDKIKKLIRDIDSIKYIRAKRLIHQDQAISEELIDEVQKKLEVSSKPKSIKAKLMKKINCW